jgi:hypothetical protein
MCRGYKIYELLTSQVFFWPGLPRGTEEFCAAAEVEAAEAAEMQRLQILRVANKLSSVFFPLTLPSLSNSQSAADLEVPRNYVQLAEVEVAEVSRLISNRIKRFCPCVASIYTESIVAWERGTAN